MVRLAERDRDHFAGAEHGTHAKGREHERGQRRPPQGLPRDPFLPKRGAGGRFGGTQRCEGDCPDHRGDDSGRQSRQRMHGGRQHGHQHRADDEHHLVDDRLEGERGLQDPLVLDRGRSSESAPPSRPEACRPRRDRRTRAARGSATRPRPRPSASPATPGRWPARRAAPGAGRGCPSAWPGTGRRPHSR